MAYQKLNSFSYLNREYVRMRRTIRDIAAEVGCNVESVRLALRRNGIPARSARDYTKLDITKERLEDLYIKEHKTAYEISRILHCHERKVSGKLRAFKIPTQRRQKQDLKRDLKYERFGRLSVRRRHHADEKGDVFWECLCDCGNIVVTRARNLLRIGSGTRSCGCKKTKIPWRVIPQFVWCTIGAKAKNRNIPFRISREFGEDLFDKQHGRCALSGQEIRFASKRKEAHSTTASLDRIDSGGDYVEDNVQWVHKHINKMKQTFSNEEFVRLCMMVADRHRTLLSSGG